MSTRKFLPTASCPLPIIEAKHDRHRDFRCGLNGLIARVARVPTTLHRAVTGRLYRGRGKIDYTRPAFFGAVAEAGTTWGLPNLKNLE